MQADTRSRQSTGARAALWLAFFGLCLGGWVASWRMVAGQGGWLCSAADVALLPLGGFPVLAAMWAAMTAAMMLPAFVPALAAFLRLPIPHAARDAVALTTGYLIVWTAASLLFAAAQATLIGRGALTAAGALSSPLVSAGLLLIAGLWQISRPKAACQRACIRPELRFLARLRPGPVGAFQIGLELGAFCLGCCWALMALGFVGGTMSLLWMGLATLFMVAEKLPALGEPLRRPAGIAMILAALWFGIPG